MRFFSPASLAFALIPNLMVAAVFAEGNVTVEFAGNGKLKIRGEDNTNQRIRIIQQSGGDWLLTDGAANTTFNGQPSVLVTQFNADVEMDLRSGNKVLTIESASGPVSVPAGLKITANNKSNEFVVIQLFGLSVMGKTSIKTGDGGDEIALIGGAYDEQVGINSGSGNDVINLQPTAANESLQFHDDAAIATGKGNDFVAIYSIMAPNQISLKTGGQDDDVLVFTSTIGTLKVNGNGGFDTASLNNNVFDSLPVLKSLEIVQP